MMWNAFTKALRKQKTKPQSFLNTNEEHEVFWQWSFILLAYKNQGKSMLKITVVYKIEKIIVDETGFKISQRISTL